MVLAVRLFWARSGGPQSPLIRADFDGDDLIASEQLIAHSASSMGQARRRSDDGAHRLG
jgi:hypothetical protein